MGMTMITDICQGEPIAKDWLNQDLWRADPFPVTRFGTQQYVKDES